MPVFKPVIGIGILLVFETETKKYIHRYYAIDLVFRDQFLKKKLTQVLETKM